MALREDFEPTVTLSHAVGQFDGLFVGIVKSATNDVLAANGPFWSRWFMFDEDEPTDGLVVARFGDRVSIVDPDGDAFTIALEEVEEVQF